MASLEFDQVTKTYPGPVTALAQFTLSVADQELIVLVGRSGAGKTTALRLVAGLERSTSGSIRMNGAPIDSWRPADRDMAMVFQQPALYAHLTVRQNAEFPLRMRRRSQAEMDRRIDSAAEQLAITELLDRYPDTLSGGEAQRAALARALVRRPNCLLLDEPFASLDAPLRAELRRQLRQAHGRDPVTTLFVTHDQEEALALADRLVVMRGGVIEQTGTPEQIYERPANRFVAGFIGSPPMNLVEGTLVNHGQQLRFAFGDAWLPIAAHLRARLSPYAGQAMTLGLRPQRLTLAPRPTHGELSPLRVVVEHREFLGDRWLIHGATRSGVKLSALVEHPATAAVGETIDFYACPAQAHFFAASDTGHNLTAE